MSSKSMLEDWRIFKGNWEGFSELPEQERQKIMDTYTEGWLDGHAFVHKQIKDGELDWVKGRRGMKLVPQYDREFHNSVWPGTSEMLDAGVTAFDKNYGPHGMKETLTAVYNAMVKAAPSLAHIGHETGIPVTEKPGKIT